MTIQDFMRESRDALRDHFSEEGIDNIIIEQDEVVKANDTRLHGFDIKLTDLPVGMKIYFDDLFERKAAGESMEELLQEMKFRIADGLHELLLRAGDLPTEREDYEFESVKRRLSVRLLDVRKNKSYMEHRPYIDVGNGLALIAYINGNEDIDSEWKLAVTNDLVRDMGCGIGELLTEALLNTMRAEPPRMIKISESLFEGRETNYLEEEAEDNAGSRDVYSLTNTTRFQGAAALYYPGVMERVSEVIGCGYYVIPSSIHEVIIVPDELGVEPHNLVSALRSGNRELIDEEDVLSDKIFHYEPGDENLKIAA